MLQRDAAVVGERQLVERAQAVGALVNVLAAGGLARVAIRFERSHDRLEVARRERALVVTDDVRDAQVRIGLQQRRPDRVAAGQQPAAEVQPQLFDPPVGPAVGDDRDRKIDSSVLIIEMKHELPETVPLGVNALDLLDGVVPSEPGARFGHERRKGPAPFTRPRTGSCSSGMPTNDPLSASGSPAIRPSK